MRNAEKEEQLKKEAEAEEARDKAAWDAKMKTKPKPKKKAKKASKKMDIDDPPGDEEMKEPDAKVEVVEQGYAVKIVPGAGPTFTIRKGDKVSFKDDPLPWTVEKVRAEEVSVDLKRGERTKNTVATKLIPAIDEKDLKTPTGWYRIVGVVTHKGQDANAGHYIGYARESEIPAKGPLQPKQPARWLKFDDERTTVVDDAHMQQLYGGTGDMQMGYLCIYAECEPWEEDAIRS